MTLLKVSGQQHTHHMLFYGAGNQILPKSIPMKKCYYYHYHFYFPYHYYYQIPFLTNQCVGINISIIFSLGLLQSNFNQKVKRRIDFGLIYN